MFGNRRSRDMTKYCHFHEDHRHDTNDFHQLRNQIEKAVKSGQLSHLVKGIKKEKAKASDTQREEGKKDKGIVPVEALILMISRGEHYTRSNTSKEPTSEYREITFPPFTGNNNSSALVIIKARIFGRQVNRVYMDSGSSCEVIYKHCFLKLKPSIRASRVDSKVPLIELSGEHSRPIGEVTLEITICNAPFSKTKTLNFVIFNTIQGIDTVFSTYESGKVKEGLKKVKEASPTDVKGIFNCTNVEEREKERSAIDKVSSYQVGRNLEAYVNDMVIKSTSEEDMLKDIQETFERFRSINMKLNPKKCSFSVEEGPFLGHLITTQGLYQRAPKGPFLSSRYSKVAQTKKYTMDARGRRSLPKNEEVYGNLANTHSPNKGRSSNDVPHSFDEKHKRNPFCRKRRRRSPRLLRKQGS
ncbi:hypothetical protein Tco_0400099 [Tanacetum coccineum]